MKLNILIKHKLYLLFTFLSLIMLNINYIQAQTVTVCNNGGFEQDFLHYTGSISDLYTGSDNCIPLDKNGNLSVFTTVTLPKLKRIEIVSSGIDSLVGLQQVKFGNKALRLNSKYSHSTTQSQQCRGSRGVDRITKQFTVTAATREFTVWYALALENPGAHNNTQPFFNIKCDLDPSNELCFDAAFLTCEQSVSDTICNYDDVDIVNWTCHNFRIPESEIGNTATLEITLADCGEDEHFGYAYIDGICETCEDSTFGSITLDTMVNYCYNDSAQICGSYTLPNICNSNWFVKEITVLGYQITNLLIDEASQTFCFDFLLSNFGSNDCLDIYAKIILANIEGSAPAQISNEIEVCSTKFVSYINYVTTSTCNNNGTSDFISDDYYYVTVDIINATGLSWSIIRELYDPYDGESGIYEISSGSGNTTLTLGPFRIQEGPWKLTLFIEDCEYEYDINPPNYCGNCTALDEVQIGNVKCISGSPDEWTFDIYVPGTSSYTLTTNGSTSPSLSMGLVHTIPAGSIGLSCIDYKIQINQSCFYNFKICPPKPCSITCEVEVYVKDITCYTDGNNIVNYSVSLNASGPSGMYLCYNVYGLTSSTSLASGSLPGNQIIGAFTEDIELTLYLCNNANCTTGCLPPSCYKILYIPQPGTCTQPAPYTNVKKTDMDQIMIKIVPNPILSNSFIVISPFNQTKITIIDNFGNQIKQIFFSDSEYEVFFDAPSGVYIMRYEGDSNKSGVFKFIKH